MATSRNNITSIAQTPRGLTKQQQAVSSVGLSAMGFSNKGIKAIQQEAAGTTAIGLNRFTTEFVKQVKKADKAVSDIMNGTPQNPNSKLLNPIKYGLIPLTELIASIDLCNVVTYLINQAPGGKPFNPNNNPDANTVLGRKKYQLQYAAFRIQGYIDNYYSLSSDIKNSKDPENRSGLQNILVKIVEEITRLDEATDAIFDNPEINNAFPQLSNYTNFMTGAKMLFNQYTDLRTIPLGNEYRKILDKIDKLRSVCILIQGLNKPSNLIAFADTFLGGKIGEQIQKLNKLIDPKKILSVLKDINKGVVKLSNAIKQVLNAVNIIRTIISILNVLVKIFYIIYAFMTGMPIPSMFTTAGVQNVISQSTNKVIEKVRFFMDRLNEINRIMSSIYFFCTKRIIEIGQIQNYLRATAINLQNCDITPEAKNNIDNSIAITNNSLSNLTNFVQNYENNLTKRKNRIGEYTIQILTEEVVDDGISIRRRYGVALDKNQIVVVKSTPTFATNDQVIIDEVKLLLPKRKNNNIIPPEDLDTLNQSLNYLETDEPLEGEFEIQDEPDDEDTDSEDDEPGNGLGLQGFINKLKGGRKLRRRMRREMAKAKRRLARDLARSNPNSKGSKKAEISALKAEIEVLKDDLKAAQKKLTITIAAAILNPALRPLIVILRKKVKDIEKQIKEKEQKLSQVTKTP